MEQTVAVDKLGLRHAHFNSESASVHVNVHSDLFTYVDVYVYLVTYQYKNTAL